MLIPVQTGGDGVKYKVLFSSFLLVAFVFAVMGVAFYALASQVGQANERITAISQALASCRQQVAGMQTQIGVLSAMLDPVVLLLVGMIVMIIGFLVGILVARICLIPSPAPKSMPQPQGVQYVFLLTADPASRQQSEQVLGAARNGATHSHSKKPRRIGE